MNEIETLKQTIAALEKLISIKDQTISSLQSRPYYGWQQYPYYQDQWYSTNGANQGALNQGINQISLNHQQGCNQGMQLCSVSGGQS